MWEDVHRLYAYTSLLNIRAASLLYYLIKSKCYISHCNTISFCLYFLIVELLSVYILIFLMPYFQSTVG